MRRLNQALLLWVMLLVFSPQASMAALDPEAKAEIDALKKQVEDLTKLLTEHIQTKQEVKKLKTILARNKVEKQDMKKLVVEQKEIKKRGRNPCCATRRNR
tara:strand:+ start:3308 stop:3610 length:303 start_codon:yes stop_codon:yes gene_type:complete